MSDQSFVDQIKISQSSRFYYYTYSNNLNHDDIAFNSSNNHIIPANKDILKEIERLKIGEKIHLSGYLVNVIQIIHDTDVRILKTSTIRTDTGAGACEVFLVEEVY